MKKKHNIFCCFQKQPFPELLFSTLDQKPSRDGGFSAEDREAIRPEDGQRARVKDAFHETWSLKVFEKESK